MTQRPYPATLKRNPHKIHFFLGSAHPEQQHFVPGTDATGSETAWEAGTQNSLIHGKELGSWLIWTGSWWGICLAFGRKKSIPAASQCSLGQLINGNCSREGEQHIFTSLASKDI